jgi:hypothetical protein
LHQIIRLFNAAGASIKLALSGYYQKAFDQVRDVTPPALGERRHGGLSGRSIPVRRAATFVVPENECPHPRRAYRRRIGLIDATDNFAVRKHVEIIVAPLA